MAQPLIGGMRRGVGGVGGRYGEHPSWKRMPAEEGGNVRGILCSSFTTKFGFVRLVKAKKKEKEERAAASEEPPMSRRSPCHQYYILNTVFCDSVPLLNRLPDGNRCALQ